MFLCWSKSKSKAPADDFSDFCDLETGEMFKIEAGRSPDPYNIKLPLREVLFILPFPYPFPLSPFPFPLSPFPFPLSPFPFPLSPFPFLFPLPLPYLIRSTPSRNSVPAGRGQLTSSSPPFTEFHLSRFFFKTSPTYTDS
jgi:hypothetical protein